MSWVWQSYRSRTRRSRLPAIVRRIAATGSPRIEQIPGTPDAALGSLKDAIALERPGGVYGAFSTQNGLRVVRLSSHFERLADSAARLGFVCTFDAALVANEICAVIQEAGFGEARVRISIHPDEVATACPFVLAVEEFGGVYPSIKTNGVRVTTVKASRGDNPRAKQTAWLSERRELHASSERLVYERLLVAESGEILEGTRSNFYAIVEDHHPTLRTEAANILHGIARSIVLEVSPHIVEVVFTTISTSEIEGVREAFLTSASRGVIPIVEIDSTPISDGPGPITSRISQAYDERARELEEPLCTSRW